MGRRATPLRAFVAMRIGEPTADRLFRKAISPALRACGLTPIRIDKIDHNDDIDDIDDRIMEEIQRADIVVADLTFARPSVYFEGGYATGLGKPVIYTARGDHFRDKDGDPHGNLRVHFDLQMKNIIDWTDPESATFRKRLERRLRFVLAPIVRKRNADAAAAEVRAEFLRLPVSRRLEASSQAVATCLESLGYGLVELGTTEAYPYTHATQMLARRVPEKLLNRGFVGTRRSPGAIEATWVRIEETLPLSSLSAMNTLLEVAPPHDMNPPKGVRPGRVIEHVLLCSLKTLPISRVHTAFKAYRQVRDHEFVASMRQLIPSARIRDEIIFLGQQYGLLWQAMAFDPGNRPRAAKEYQAMGGSLQTPASFTNVSFPWSKKDKPKPVIHGKTRDVPRQVHIHIIDAIDSIPSLESKLDEVRDRILHASNVTP